MKKAHTENRNILKPGYILFPVSFLLAIASVIEINYAFMVGMFGVPISISILITRIKNIKRLSTVSKWLSYVGCIVLLVSGPSGCAYNTLKIKQGMLAIASEIESIKNKQGSYPKEIDKLSLVNSPLCYGSLIKILYVKRSEKDYSLTCVTFAFNKLTYESKEKIWRNWD